jgi:hypothetical protein
MTAFAELDIGSDYTMRTNFAGRMNGALRVNDRGRMDGHLELGNL